MKWTGWGTLACAAVLTIACAGDTQTDGTETDAPGTVGTSTTDNDRAGLDDRGQIGTADRTGDTPAIGTSGQATAGRAGQQAPGTSGDARQFVSQAAEAGRAEVELGQLAAERAQSNDVKQFAQMMIRDHSKANDEMKQRVAGHDVKMPAQLSEKHQMLMTRLRTLRGAEFDREYMAAMVEGHQEAVNLLEGRARNTQPRAPSSQGQSPRSETGAPGATGTGGTAQLDTAVDQWAAKNLPVVQQHLKQAQQIHSQLQSGGSNERGGSTTGGSPRPGTPDDQDRNPGAGR
jgi:putative membrane protein